MLEQNDNGVIICVRVFFLFVLLSQFEKRTLEPGETDQLQADSRIIKKPPINVLIHVRSMNGFICACVVMFIRNA